MNYCEICDIETDTECCPNCGRNLLDIPEEPDDMDVAHIAQEDALLEKEES